MIKLIMVLSSHIPVGKSFVITINRIFITSEAIPFYHSMYDYGARRDFHQELRDARHHTAAQGFNEE